MTTTYQNKAQATRARRQAAGKYPTQAQILAGRKLINQGCNALSRAELELLATHPDMCGSQRMAYRIMADARTQPQDGALQATIDLGDAVQSAEDATVDGAYALGQSDYNTGSYAPPAATAEHDAYISGHNDAWKHANNVRWFRR